MESLTPSASPSISIARPPAGTSRPSTSPSRLILAASSHRPRQLPCPDACLRTFPTLGPSFPGPCTTGRSSRREMAPCCTSSGEGPSSEGDGDDLEKALRLDGTIPGSSGEFVRRVSSRAYDIRRHLEQSIDSSSYDVLENNPWREDSKPVYVLTQRENQLCTMKTRRSRSEVERELGLLFSKSGKWRPEVGNKTKQSRAGTKFHMLVEDIREGVLVFEDEHDAAKYCDLLQGGGQNCDGVAEIEASSVFDICRKMRALAVLFRRGRTPPLPESLEINLRARKRSLEDQ